MKKVVFLAFLSLLATQTANAQDYLNINGEWRAANERCYCGGNQTRNPSIYSSGNDVTFTNTCGDSSPGQWVGQGQIRAITWGVTARVLNPGLIRWSNGCAWTRGYGQY